MNNKPETLKELEAVFFQSYLTEEEFWSQYQRITSLCTGEGSFYFYGLQWDKLDEITFFSHHLRYIQGVIRNRYPRSGNMGFLRKPEPPMEYINELLASHLATDWKNLGYLEEGFTRTPEGSLCATPWTRMKYFMLKKNTQFPRKPEKTQRFQKGIFRSGGFLRQYLHENPVLWGIEGEKLPCIDETTQEIYDWFWNEDELNPIILPREPEVEIDDWSWFSWEDDFKELKDEL